MLPVGLNELVNVAWSETVPPMPTPADGVVVIPVVAWATATVSWPVPHGVVNEVLLESPA